MKIDILTLFPRMFEGVFNESILKKAQEKSLLRFNLVNYRDYSLNKHHKVDDYPYGGGAGMVLSPQPIFDAVEAVVRTSKTKPRILLMCPQGEPFTQKKAEELSEEKHLIFICGHYEGYDERIRTHLATDELSIGDFILTGGELASMVIIDSVARLIPGVLGNQASHQQDSYSTGLLEHPHYTRPQDFRGMKVPEVLLSGDHKKIGEWRRKESLRRTIERRPDLLKENLLTEEDKLFLSKLKQEKS
ncbi:tRNA (guanosine(37)-N1)-methyltransferase TrmD [Pueribacillus theae]|uniref:tRNA (guanine-N(1)-)-methyltransferase n=1 Tax=Pueribacillus theae TaxID=2171751 RepID=A0A2U1K852_9BACI|nr:tRNA (guanosine(37)-N1)-methyltransferase TrmD [Pueribacillus theae]PWA13484.1 tRNA (guanosine(37)-N1)-methyltransferase TrmD [Pueribacillus theae]